MSEHDPSNSTDFSRSTQVSQPKKIYLKVFAHSMTRFYDCGVLLTEAAELKTQFLIDRNSLVLLNPTSCKTKMMSLVNRIENGDSWKKDGYLELATVLPTMNKSGELCFRLLPGEIQQQIGMNTFLNIHPSLGINTIFLRDRDVIKMGRVIYEIRTDSQSHWDEINQSFGNQGQCRICLSGQNSNPSDVLVSPCRCTGSCANVHIECLRRWIQQKATVRKNYNVTTYDMSKLHCEICQARYPQSIRVEGQKISLLPRPKFANLTLEQIEDKNQQLQGGQMLHVVSLQGNRPIKIGRSQDNDLMIEELSVSRHHAKLLMNEDKIELVDCSSKYGTFVLFRRQLQECTSVNILNKRWTFRVQVQ